jgi:3-methyladenine DNA glycosylase/8-oxoguanine DNA glycosylase
VRSHGWYDLPPFSYDRERAVLTTPSASFSVSSGELVAESGVLAAAALTKTARRIFSFDLDFTAFAASVQGEPDLARALARGGGRMLRAPSVFEDAVKMLLTTNCTWAATRRMVVRLIDLHGTGAFPQPEDVARFSRRRLRDKVRCGYRAEALARFARRVASSKLDLSRWEDPQVPAEEVRQSILLEHGFGPYAAEGLLRIVGRHDFLAIDSWIRQQYRRQYPGSKKSTDGSISRRYARYGTFKGLALWLDMTRHWHEDLNTTTESPKSKV